jgi:hypothetical protein
MDTILIPGPPGAGDPGPRAKPSAPPGPIGPGARSPHICGQLVAPAGPRDPPSTRCEQACGPSGPPPGRSSPVSAWPGSSPLVTETTSSALFAGHATVITLRTPTMPHRGDYVNTPGQGPKTARRNFCQLSSSDPSCLTEPPAPQAFRAQNPGTGHRSRWGCPAGIRASAAGWRGRRAGIRAPATAPAGVAARNPGTGRRLARPPGRDPALHGPGTRWPNEVTQGGAERPPPPIAGTFFRDRGGFFAHMTTNQPRSWKPAAGGAPTARSWPTGVKAR